MREKTINDFIKELQHISEDKRELPLVVTAPNGMRFEPKIKMLFKDDNMFSGEVVKMVIEY